MSPLDLLQQDQTELLRLHQNLHLPSQTLSLLVRFRRHYRMTASLHQHLRALAPTRPEEEQT